MVCGKGGGGGGGVMFNMAGKYGGGWLGMGNGNGGAEVDMAGSGGGGGGGGRGGGGDGVPQDLQGPCTQAAVHMQSDLGPS